MEQHYSTTEGSEKVHCVPLGINNTRRASEPSATTAERVYPLDYA